MLSVYNLYFDAEINVLMIREGLSVILQYE